MSFFFSRVRDYNQPIFWIYQARGVDMISMVHYLRSDNCTRIRWRFVSDYLFRRYSKMELLGRIARIWFLILQKLWHFGVCVFPITFWRSLTPGCRYCEHLAATLPSSDTLSTNNGNEAGQLYFWGYFGLPAMPGTMALFCRAALFLALLYSCEIMTPRKQRIDLSGVFPRSCTVQLQLTESLKFFCSVC